MDGAIIGQVQSSSVQPECVAESPEGLVQLDGWSSPPQLSDGVGLGWSLRISILHKLPGDTDALFPGPHLENH